MTDRLRPGRRAFLALAAVTLAPRVVRAEEGGREKLEGAKLDQVLGDVAKARKGLKSLRAAFTQERKLSLLATSVKSTGELVTVTPDRLRWELAPPDDIVYFVGPEGLSYRSRSSRGTTSAQGANIARALADLRALLSGDIGALRERYVLSGSRSPADVEIDGTSKDKNASVKAFVLVLDKGLLVPLRSRLVEGKNDTIDLVFSNAQVNGPVDPATMKP
jgi:outer membrane lipoprotein-sorting protein